MSKIKSKLRNEEGAIDLASIMVGILVIGLIGGVISATVFAVIPWAQDKAAQQQLDSISVAQAAYKARSSAVDAESSGFVPNSYANSEALQTTGLLRMGEGYCTFPRDGGYVGFTQSSSGKNFMISDKNTSPVEHANPTEEEAAMPGCGFLKNSGGDPAAPTPEATPTTPPVNLYEAKTILTYKCDATLTDVLPFENIANGRLTIEGDDGTKTEAIYTDAPATSASTFNAGVTYKVMLEGTYTKFTQTKTNKLRNCVRSMDQWDEKTGVTDASNGFYWNINLLTVPNTIPSTITNMSNMFYNAAKFNQSSLNGWNTSNVTNMASMFREALAFNGDVSSWDTSNVTNMSQMFLHAKKFNGGVSSWDTSNVTNMSEMFDNALVFNQPLGAWDTSKVTDMSQMFVSAFRFNQDISTWDTSSVTTMSQMFYNTTDFNGTISTWDTSKVADMSYMFNAANAFNQPLNGWDTSNVTDMSLMFYNNTIFDGDISSWNTSNVTNMSLMFEGATIFNKPLNNWDTSNVTNMTSMFREATAFNQPLNDWDVSSVTEMYYMFESATAFNQPLNNWDVSSVTDMYSMFSRATAFNQPLNNWDVSSVTDMYSMFSRATAFNQPLNNWNTAKVTDVDYMFLLASAFNQDISMWKFNTTPTHYGFSSSSTLKSSYVPKW